MSLYKLHERNKFLIFLFNFVRKKSAFSYGQDKGYYNNYVSFFLKKNENMKNIAVFLLKVRSVYF